MTSARRRLPVSALMALFLGSTPIGACGKKIVSERHQHGGEAPAEVATDLTVKGAGLPSYCKEISTPAPITGDAFSDLAAILENSLKLVTGGSEQRNLCLSCKPRLLERIQCMMVDLGGIDEICTNNISDAEEGASTPAVKCKSGLGDDGKTNFEVFDLRPNRVESVISFLPMLSFLIQSQIAGKLVDGTRQKLMADAAIEFAQKHATNVFLGNSLDDATEYAVAKIDEYLRFSEKSLTSENRLALSDAVKRSFVDIGGIATRSDQVTAEQLQSMTARIYEVVPELEKYQFVLPVLLIPGSTDMLTQALGGLISGDALQLLEQMFK